MPISRGLLLLLLILGVVGAGQAAPAVSFGASRLEYGNQLVGIRSAPQPLTLTNSGDSQLTIHSVSLTGPQAADFVIQSDSGPATLAPGACRTLGIQCRPLAVGERSAVLAVSSNAAGSPHLVSLAGNGVTTFVNRSPRSIDFGSVPLQTLAPWQRLTIRNGGNTTLHITETRIGGPSPFFIQKAVPGEPFKFALTPGESTAVNLSIYSYRTGPQTAYLYIYDDAPFSPHIVTLSANCVVSIPAPTNLAAQVSEAAKPIHLTWTDNSNNETGFEIDRQVNAWGWGWERTNAPWPANTTAVDIGSWGWTPLSADFSFRVRAVNQYGASEWSNVVTVNLRFPPPAPTNLTATGNSDGIELSWERQGFGLSSYEVWRKRDGFDWILVKEISGDTRVMNYGMTPGVVYTYRVRSKRDGVYSDWSNEATAIRTPAP